LVEWRHAHFQKLKTQSFPSCALDVIVRKKKFFVVFWPQVIYHHKKEFEEIATFQSESFRIVDAKYKQKYDNAIPFLKWYRGK